MSLFWCEYGLTGDGVVHGLTIETDGDTTVSVTPGIAVAPDGSTVLCGLTIPGLANVHSHAFHRALRGWAQRDRGTFWTWREEMYAVAARLDPDSYRRLATAVYAEMALAGVTVVGEFHYLHHGPDGQPYDDPNAMGHALIDAARDAGIRIALLDTCYLTGGVGQPLDGTQVRFGDGSAARWAARVDQLSLAYQGKPDVRIGAAVHSVRGVPREEIPVVARWAQDHDAPLHVHLSEQVAENDACLERYGVTPTQVLADTGALGPRTVAVHATHLTPKDIALLGGSGTGACFCPTTERDLADGIGPAPALVAAGSPLSLGSDSHAVIDLFEEARAVELNERLASQQRGTFSAEELLTAATAEGYRALGFHGGSIAPGAVADFATIRLDSVRTAGSGAHQRTAVFAATAADVTDVVVGGHLVVSRGEHHLGDIGAMLGEVLDA